MQTLNDIRKSISSVRSTMKITGAMKLMASSKLKDVQESAVRSRPYNSGLKETAMLVAKRSGEEGHPAFVLRPKIRNATIFVITPQRGFCGALSEETFKQCRYLIEMMKDREIAVHILVAGAKGAHYFRKHGLDFEKIDVGAEDMLARIKVEGLCLRLLNEYLNHETDQIILAYNRFESMLSHKVTADMFLPIWEKTAPNIRSQVDFIYEPAKAGVMDILVKKTLRTQLFQAMLEGRACELAARTIAMEKALDNARDIVKNLTRKYHTLRQASITRELLDIIGGAEALAGR